MDLDWEQVIYNLGTVGAIIAALSAWTFVSMYYNRRWRSYGEGRNVMVFSIGLAVILSWLSYRGLSNTPAIVTTCPPLTLPIHDNIARTAILLFVAFILAWRVRLAYQAGKKDKAELKRSLELIQGKREEVND